MTRFHATSEGNVPFTEEEELQWAAQVLKYENEQPRILIKSEIAILEATITPRRVREAILGMDNGWLTDMDSMIQALRAQL